MWAQAKRLDGWESTLEMVSFGGQLVGGFQILMRSISLGKIGIVLKGPILSSASSDMRLFFASRLMKAIKANRLRALIVQPADRDEDMSEALKVTGFLEFQMGDMIKESSLQIDLRGDESAIFGKVRRQKRQNIAAALRNEVKFREGNREDLHKFFVFMVETCKRQNVRPSPSQENFLIDLWDIFSPKGLIKLFFAQCEGRDISGMIVLPFSDIAYFWKFGWSGESANKRPNDFLYWEVMKWAKNHGYIYADLGAIDNCLAEVIKHNGPITEEMAKSYSYFKLGFGAQIVDLPKGYICFPNRIVRTAYRCLRSYADSSRFFRNRILLRGE